MPVCTPYGIKKPSSILHHAIMKYKDKTMVVLPVAESKIKMTILRWTIMLLLSLIALSNCSVVAGTGWRNILPLRRKDSSYTPLLFFTVPPGLNPACDATDRVVREVERELQVRVQRMDVLRQPEHEAVLRAVTQSLSRTELAQPPLLYHRESRQVYAITSPKKTASSAAVTTTPLIDKERIRAWAKGRYLSPLLGGFSTPSQAVGLPSPASGGKAEDDEAELLEELSLTSEQRKGKRLMQERTKAKENVK